MLSCKPKTRPMNDDIVLRYKSIALFKAAAEAVAPLVELAVSERTETKIELCARVFRAVADSECASTGEWLEKLILRDENPFGRAAARGERIAEHIKAQAVSELSTFKRLSLVKPSGAVDCVPKFVYGGFTLDYDGLVDFFGNHGCGALACGNMFKATCDGLRRFSVDYRLSDLAGYAEEHAELLRNTENFIGGLPAFHTLLCGDRGTGKTSAVRALGQEFPSLKIIEVDGVELLPKLIPKLSGYKQKHILFVDGLPRDMPREAQIILERALDDAGPNILVYCTADGSQTRSADGGRGESVFDRFGLVVTFVTPDRDGFAEVLEAILRRRGMRWRDEYASIAELAALKCGSRSPRTAKQIADIIETTYSESNNG